MAQYLLSRCARHYHDRGTSSLLIDDSNDYLFCILSGDFAKYCDKQITQLTVLGVRSKLSR